MTDRPRRSMLYMPATNARAIEKARTLPVDGIALDLEDSIAPDKKNDARAAVVDDVGKVVGGDERLLKVTTRADLERVALWV